MTDVGTPGSNADSSINLGKAGASKDKACPFCQQPFTSSSLGRHLDLYIKEKNPKPADGVHDVIEIRKLRGNITRRQPRNSMSRREGSTPSGTPGANGNTNGGGRRSPQSEVGHDRGSRQDVTSPTVKTRPMWVGDEGKKGNVRTILNGASWQATGVINNIPRLAPNSETGKWNDGDSVTPRHTIRRTVSKQMLAKSTFDQKAKITEALDNARAAELALREVLGSIRAAT